MNNSQTNPANQAAIEAFYQKALTVNTETNPKDALSSFLSPNFKSIGSAGSKTSEELIGQLGFFWKLIPDLKWDVQEVLNDGDKYMVRSLASGTPNGDFMGIATDGTKSFNIMTIDIHTIQDGKIIETHHVEDWATAIQQLKPANAEIATTDKEGEATLKVAMDFMDAMGKGDMETVMSLMDDDMVWQNEGDSRIPWIGPWNGKKDILEKFMPAFGAGLTTTKWETEDMMAKGDTATFFGTMAGKAVNSGAEIDDFTFALRVKVKDGKIVLWNWLEDSYAVSQAFNQ